MTSERHTLAAKRNAALATAAVLARIALRPPWKCIHCGTERPATYNWNIRKYCSMACKTADYRERFKGINNPHWRGVSLPRRCLTCGKEFVGEFKGRKYCSMSCKAKSPASVERMRKLARLGGAAAAVAFKKRPHGAMPFRFCRKDDNHSEVVNALTQLGCSTRDTSAVGGGFPDLIVGCVGMNFLVEVKNPNTKYGRKGLSSAQQEFKDSWRGPPVVVLHDADEATAWVSGLRRRLFKAHEED